jgi:peptide-methionine (R)-S-oxide reductase
MLTWKDIMHYATRGNPQPDRRVEKPLETWKAELDPKVFRITRMHGTEAPHSGALCHTHDPGAYRCACCGTTLFDSRIKFDSGTGWPSFTQPAAVNAIKYLKDTSFGMVRVEVQCNCCDAHLGHVFPDGPPPGGLRYCINSLALTHETDDGNEG